MVPSELMTLTSGARILPLRLYKSFLYTLLLSNLAIYIFFAKKIALFQDPFIIPTCRKRCQFACWGGLGAA